VPPAGLTACVLLASLVAVYGWLTFFGRGAALTAVFLVVLWYGIAGNYSGTRHRLEELDDLGYYARTNSTRRDDAAAATHRPSLYHYDELRRPAQAFGLNDRDVLDKWRKQVETGRAQRRTGAGRPPLIIVTTSGGASVSAIFTLTALTELERRMPGVTRQVRVISGASGGMLGAAYFRSQLPDFWRLQTDADRDDRIRVLQERLAGDFLSPLVQQWAFKDLPLGLSFSAPAANRARSLEQSWHDHLKGALRLTFADMRDQERDGGCPSIIFSPVMVEDGRQLLISTLELDGLVQPDEPLVRVEPPLLGPRAVPLGGDGELGQLRAVEFFKLFPDAGRLRLATAVRLNATFPFLTPAAVLPTAPPRRVVDAGYYDNFGINVAVAWAYRNRAWLRENTSEVIILQLRPYQARFKDEPRPLTPEEQDSIESARAEGAERGWGPSGLFSFQEVSTPLEGGGNSLRSSMSLRNAQQLQLLQRLLQPGDGFRGVTSFTFLGGLDASLNWYLPPVQVQEVQAVIRDAFPDHPMPKPQPELYRQRRAFREAVAWNAGQYEKLRAALRDSFP
jgi:hypothetical protein